MSAKFEFEKFYLITKVGKAGKQEFVAIDRHSGGYPYWSDYISSAEKYKEFPNLEKFFKGVDYMRRDGGEIFVLECRVEVLHQSSFKDAVFEKKQSEIRQLEEEKQKLEDKIKELQK